MCQFHSSCPFPCTCSHCQGPVPKHVPLVPGCSSAHWGSRAHGVMLPCCPCHLGTHSHRTLLAACWLTVAGYDPSLQCPVWGSPCSGTLARQGGSIPRSSKSHHYLHPLPVLPSPPALTQPQPGPSSSAHCGLDRVPGGSEDSEVGSGAEQLGPPCPMQNCLSWAQHLEGIKCLQGAT